MDMEIVKKDRSTYRMSDYGVVYDFVVGSIQMESFSERAEGRFGMVNYGADYTFRTIKVPMKFKIAEMHEFAHMRDELYAILTDTDGYYIREMRRPKRLQYEFVNFGETPKWADQTANEYVDGKQYFVRLSSTIEPEQIYNGGEIELEFDTIELPFGESIYTSTELDATRLNSEANKYSLTDGIHQDFTSNKGTQSLFDIYNAGTVTVQPESMYIKITIKNVDSTDGFSLKNLSTGDIFEYKERLVGRDLVIEGVQVKVGAINVLRSTNRQFISLKPGKNNFHLSGAGFSEIIVDFKYYYK